GIQGFSPAALADAGHFFGNGAGHPKARCAPHPHPLVSAVGYSLTNGACAVFRVAFKRRSTSPSPRMPAVMPQLAGWGTATNWAPKLIAVRPEPGLGVLKVQADPSKSQ